MVTAVLGAVAVVLAVAMAAAVLRSRVHDPSVQVDQFAAAREVTNRWSTDPTSTPVPLLDYLKDREPSNQDTDPTTN